MRHNVIIITDNRGQSFDLEIWTPSAGNKLKFWRGSRASSKEGRWKSIHKGYIRYIDGGALRDYRNNDLLTRDADLYLGADAASQDPFTWGIVLYNYDDGFGTHEMGTGKVVQPWVLALEPGLIEWKVRTASDNPHNQMVTKGPRTDAAR